MPARLMCRRVSEGNGAALLPRLRQQNNVIIVEHFETLQSRYAATNPMELANYPTMSEELLQLFDSWETTAENKLNDEREAPNESEKKKSSPPSPATLSPSGKFASSPPNATMTILELTAEADVLYHAKFLGISSKT